MRVPEIELLTHFHKGIEDERLSGCLGSHGEFKLYLSARSYVRYARGVRRAMPYKTPKSHPACVTSVASQWAAMACGRSWINTLFGSFWGCNLAFSLVAAQIDLNYADCPKSHADESLAREI